MRIIDELTEQDTLFRDIHWGELFEQNGEKYLKIQGMPTYNAVNMTGYTTERIDPDSYVIPLETTLTITKRGK